MLRSATIKFDTFLRNGASLFLSTALPSPNDDHSSRNPERFAQPSSFLDDSALNIVPYFDFPGVIIVSVCDSDHDSPRISGSRFERVREIRFFLTINGRHFPLNIPLKRPFTWLLTFYSASFILFPSCFFSSLSLSSSICRSSNFRGFKLMNNPISDFLKTRSLPVWLEYEKKILRWDDRRSKEKNIFNTFYIRIKNVIQKLYLFFVCTTRGVSQRTRGALS